MALSKLCVLEAGLVNTVYLAATQTPTRTDGKKNKRLILYSLDLYRSSEHIVYWADITACPNSFREGLKIDVQLGVSCIRHDELCSLF